MRERDGSSIDDSRHQAERVVPPIKAKRALEIQIEKERDSFLLGNKPAIAQADTSLSLSSSVVNDYDE